MVSLGVSWNDNFRLARVDRTDDFEGLFLLLSIFDIKLIVTLKLRVLDDNHWVPFLIDNLLLLLVDDFGPCWSCLELCDESLESLDLGKKLLDSRISLHDCHIQRLDQSELLSDVDVEHMDLAVEILLLDGPLMPLNPQLFLQ